MRLHPTVAAVLLAVGACCHSGDTWAQTPPPAAEAPTLRPEIAPPLQAAQKAINDKDFATALQQLQAAEQVAGRTPFETYVLERLRFLAAAGQRDTPGALKALEAALATGQVEAELKATLMDQASNAAYALKDYDKTVHWARQALAAGATADITRLRLAQALYLQGQHAPAAQVLAELATQQRAAGQVPTEPQLRLQASNLLKMGDEAGYARVLEGPDRAGAQARALGRPPGPPAAPAELRRGADARPVPPEPACRCLRHHRGGSAARRPGAARRLSGRSEGGARRRFRGRPAGPGPQAAQHQALRDKATKAAVADAAGSTSDGPALLARDPALALAAGWAQFTAGQRDAGLALMRQAVQKAPQPRLQLRLAEALRTAGDTAAARTALTAARDAAATDGTSDLARLALLSLGRP